MSMSSTKEKFHQKNECDNFDAIKKHHLRRFLMMNGRRETGEGGPHMLGEHS